MGERIEHYPELHQAIWNLNSKVWERDLKLKTLVDGLVAHIRQSKDTEEARTVKLWRMHWIHFQDDFKKQHHETTYDHFILKTETHDIEKLNGVIRDMFSDIVKGFADIQQWSPFNEAFVWKKDLELEMLEVSSEVKSE